jgi:hypothetical protein
MTIPLPSHRDALKRGEQTGAHLCLASIPLQTSEHLAAIANQATAMGFDVCWLLLESPGALSSSSATHTASIIDSVHFYPIETAEGLEAHFSVSRPVAIFLQTPYREHYPEWFWQSKWLDRMCFAGYGASLSTWEHGLYDLPSLHDCAWLLAESDFTQKKYADHGNRPDRIVVTGNPLMYELRGRLADPNAQDPDSKAVLWAPHWTSAWFGLARGFSRWREAVVPFLEFARLHPEITILARPHPLLLDRFVELSDDLSLASDREERGLGELLALENVVISDRSFVDDILRSDALVTDGVSIIAYYAATGKPLAIMRDADSPPFNQVGESLCAMSDLLPNAASLAAWLANQVDQSFAETSVSRQELSSLVHPTQTDSPISIWAAHAGLVSRDSSG